MNEHGYKVMCREVGVKRYKRHAAVKTNQSVEGLREYYSRCNVGNEIKIIPIRRSEAERIWKDCPF